MLLNKNIRGQFHQRFWRDSFVQNFKPKSQLGSFFASKIHTKNALKNDDEIDNWHDSKGGITSIPSSTQEDSHGLMKLRRSNTNKRSFK